jgi:hypothetical protein
LIHGRVKLDPHKLLLSKRAGRPDRGRFTIKSPWPVFGLGGQVRRSAFAAGSRPNVLNPLLEAMSNVPT